MYSKIKYLIINNIIIFTATARYAAQKVGKGFATFDKFKSVYGVAGNGKAWHHIESQRTSNITKFGAEKNSKYE